MSFVPHRPPSPQREPEGLLAPAGALQAGLGEICQTRSEARALNGHHSKQAHAMTPDSPEIDFKALIAHFPSSVIEWRVGDMNAERTRGTAVPYISARVVQQRLDDACGPQNWKVEYRPNANGTALVCALSLRINGEWVCKEDGAEVGAEDGEGRGKAVKGSFSSALKRAAVVWGVGRYLYGFQAPWVDLDPAKGWFALHPMLPAHMLPGKEGTPAPADAESSSASQGRSQSRPAASASTGNTSNTKARGQQSKPASVGSVPSAAASRAPANEAALTRDFDPDTGEILEVGQGVEGGADTGAEEVSDEMVAALPATIQSYMRTMVSYVREGKNLTIVRDSAEKGKVREKLQGHEGIRLALLRMVQAKLGAD